MDYNQLNVILASKVTISWTVAAKLANLDVLIAKITHSAYNVRMDTILRIWLALAALVIAKFVMNFTVSNVEINIF